MRKRVQEGNDRKLTNLSIWVYFSQKNHLTTFEMLKDILLLRNHKKENDLTYIRYLQFLDVHSHKFGHIKDSIITQLQKDNGNFSSGKQKWFPAPYAAISCVPAQLPLVNGCPNTSEYQTNTKWPNLRLSLSWSGLSWAILTELCFSYLTFPPSPRVSLKKPYSLINQTFLPHAPWIGISF